MPDVFDNQLGLNVNEAIAGQERRLCPMVPIDAKGTAIPAIWVSPWTYVLSGTRGRQVILLSNPGPPMPEIITSFVPENLIKRLPSKPIVYGPFGPKPTIDTQVTAGVSLYLSDDLSDNPELAQMIQLHDDPRPDFYQCRLVHLDSMARDVPILWTSPYIDDSDPEIGPARICVMLLHPGPGKNIAVNGSHISLQFFNPKTISSPVPFGPKGPQLVQGDIQVV